MRSFFVLVVLLVLSCGVVSGSVYRSGDSVIYDTEWANLTITPENVTGRFPVKQEFIACNKRPSAGYLFAGYRFNDTLIEADAYLWKNITSTKSRYTYGDVEHDYTCDEEYNYTWVEPYSDDNYMTCYVNNATNTSILWEGQFDTHGMPGSPTVYYTREEITGTESYDTYRMGYSNINSAFDMHTLEGKPVYHNTQGKYLQPDECVNFKISYTPKYKEGKWDAVLYGHGEDDWTCILDDSCAYKGFIDPTWNLSAGFPYFYENDTVLWTKLNLSIGEGIQLEISNVSGYAENGSNVFSLLFDDFTYADQSAAETAGWTFGGSNGNRNFDFDGEYAHVEASGSNYAGSDAVMNKSFSQESAEHRLLSRVRRTSYSGTAQAGSFFRGSVYAEAKIYNGYYQSNNNAWLYGIQGSSLTYDVVKISPIDDKFHRFRTNFFNGSVGEFFKNDTSMHNLSNWLSDVKIDRASIAVVYPTTNVSVDYLAVANFTGEFYDINVSRHDDNTYYVNVTNNGSVDLVDYEFRVVGVDLGENDLVVEVVEETPDVVVNTTASFISPCPACKYRNLSVNVSFSSTDFSDCYYRLNDYSPVSFDCNNFLVRAGTGFNELCLLNSSDSELDCVSFYAWSDGFDWGDILLVVMLIIGGLVLGFGTSGFALPVIGGLLLVMGGFHAFVFGWWFSSCLWVVAVACLLRAVLER